MDDWLTNKELALIIIDAVTHINRATGNGSSLEIRKCVSMDG